MPPVSAGKSRPTAGLSTAAVLRRRSVLSKENAIVRSSGHTEVSVSPDALLSARIADDRASRREAIRTVVAPPKGRREAKPVKKRAAAKSKKQAANYGAQVRTWAGAYIALTVTISMGLNAYANGLHAPSEMLFAAWGMGAVIPLLVLILGRVAGLLYKQQAARTALAVASIGVGVLGLSVFHCCESISLLTGSHRLLATLLAIGIDCGFVACEVAILVGGDD
jgi:hypothetical protein